MDNRAVFDEELRNVLNIKLYYTPPSNIKMEVPCCIYTIDNIVTNRADDAHYIINVKYSLTIIHKDASLDKVTALLNHFPNSAFDRRYISDGMYHDVVTIYK